MSNPLRIGINGFGRIGRLAYRYAAFMDDVEVVGINDLVDANQLAYLLGHDTVHGPFPSRERGGAVVADGDLLKVTDATGAVKTTAKVMAYRDPAEIPWDALEVDVVLECTGFFLSRETASAHFKGAGNQGVKRVVLSAPAKDADIRTVVMGVNDATVTDGEADRVISNASCTTNCLAPVVKVIHEAFTIKSLYFNTIHAYTNDQNTVDSPHKKDLRRARTAAANIIPTSTGAAKAIMKIYPELDGKMFGVATRVPVPDGSATDIVMQLAKPFTKEGVNAALKAAADGDLKGVLEYNLDHPVSSDIVGNPHSSVVDAEVTMVVDATTLRIMSWYDNETGYAYRLVDLVKRLHG